MVNNRHAILLVTLHTSTRRYLLVDQQMFDYTQALSPRLPHNIPFQSPAPCSHHFFIFYTLLPPELLYFQNGANQEETACKENSLYTYLLSKGTYTLSVCYFTRYFQKHHHVSLNLYWQIYVTRAHTVVQEFLFCFNFSFPLAVILSLYCYLII